jgi:type 2 lantibiotic biosynthesis protein LanM
MTEIPEPILTEPKKPLTASFGYRGTTLRERVTNRALLVNYPEQPDFNEKVASRRLSRWREKRYFQKDANFKHWLTLHNLDETTFYQLLGELDGSLKNRFTSTPSWLVELNRVLEEFNPQTDNIPFPTVPTELQKGLILLESIRPLIIAGLKRFQNGVAKLVQNYQENLPFNPDRVSELLFPNLLIPLLDRLNQTLALEVNIARYQDQLQGENPEERFYNWTKSLGLGGGIKGIFEEYPVLARQLLQALDNWVLTSLEFLERLCADWSHLQVTFGLATVDSPVQLSLAESGTGDAHRGGRSVYKLKFSNGLQLMYKPKSLAIDVHFQELLTWLNQKGLQPPLATFKVLDRGDYGWTEFIHAAGCTSEAEIERFYERQGSFLALFYLLEATDFHFENLIAAGENPMPIDLEALFHPRLAEISANHATDVAASLVGYSVLRVGLLPVRSWSSERNIGIDLSGLNGKGGQLTPRPVQKWEGWGTDQMRLVRARVEIPERANRPKLLLGETQLEVDVLNFIPQIMTGFERTYRLIMAHRVELMAPDGPIEKFAHDEIRVVLRPTNAYGLLLHESFHPDLLRNGLDRDCFFDYLWSATDQQAFLSKVVAYEREELLLGDIPMFTSKPTLRDIFTGKQESIVDFFEQTSLKVVQQSLTNMSEADLNRQLWVIEAAFSTVPMGLEQARWKPSRLVSVAEKLESAELLAQARLVGDRLGQMAIQVGNEAGWIGLSLIQARQWSLLPAGADLYSGAGGIILYLAYLGQITGDANYTKLAKAGLVNMRQQLITGKDWITSVGGFDGWGAPIYVLAHLGVLWNEPGLFEEAGIMAENLAKYIEQDQVLDVIGGTAGGLLALLSLYSVYPHQTILEIARKCGDHLVKKARPMPQGVGWVSQLGEENKPLTGFSHGTAGVAHGLLQLANLSRQPIYQVTAQSAIAYENSAYSKENANWQDLRSEEVLGSRANSPAQAGETYMTAWCHGAPGIGLARIAALAYLPESEHSNLLTDIERAIRTTLKSGFGMNHSLCHGDLGNLDLLLYATQKLSNPAYLSAYKAKAVSILDSVKKYGWLTGIPLGVESPGLLTGIAGIGYQLLRLAEPDKVPSILLMAEPSF